MVKQITIVPVNTLPSKEANPQVEDILKNEEAPPIVEAEITKLEPEIVELKEDIKPDKVKQNVKTQLISNMATTEQVISQVQCQACGESMSAKNLNYSHAA